jgi:hypothetical protein
MYAALTDTIPSIPLTPTWRSEIIQEAKVLHSSFDLLSHLHDKPDIAARLSILGTSFFQAPWYPGLEQSMKTYLHASQRSIRYYEVATRRWSIVMPTDNDLFVLLEHQLASTRYPAAAVPSDVPPHPGAPASSSYLLNEPLRIALFAYLNTRIWHFQAFPITQCIVNALQRSLRCSPTPTSPAAPAPTVLDHIKATAPDLLFWILFIGGMAAEGHDGYSWFVDRVAELARYLGLRDWGSAREVLCGFFYADQPGEPGGEELWRLVLTREHTGGESGVSAVVTRMSGEGVGECEGDGEVASGTQAQQTRFLYKY